VTKCEHDWVSSLSEFDSLECLESAVPVNDVASADTESSDTATELADRCKHNAVYFCP